ncbi:MAG: acylase [Calditrichaeota bacterium]|nr:MAG: acylase [Calditrichota bacterium]
MIKHLAVILVSGMLVAAFLDLPIEDYHLTPLARTQKYYDVKILRDTWGVPHIFGKTDADVAYGLAYAHAEDDFDTIQKSLLAARGKLATIMGTKALANDYMVQLFRIWDVVNARYYLDLSPETRAVCEAYADGLNRYALLHPDKMIPGLFPVSGKDIVAGFVHKIPLFFGLHNVIKELYAPERQRLLSTPSSSDNYFVLKEWGLPYGSNTFSVSPIRSAEGKTMLAINSHQPWEGPFTWYEVHLHSEEGWDMVGGVFPGTPVVLHGHNRYLGWAHTVNKPDLIDVYVLEMNPQNPYQYRFDGKWRDLEVRRIKLKVKLLGPVSLTISKEVLWSVYGPVIRRPHGTYAIRYAGYGDIRQVEEWYRMNKARNFKEWLQAVQMCSIPMFNMGYADYQGNIYYLYNALLPIRAENYDWSQYLPGNTSKTLWKNYLSFDRLPQVLNPASGFVQNCNNTPFQTTIGPENPNPDDYSPTFGIENYMTNRALRAMELFASDSSITEEEFYQYKYDVAYSKKSIVAKVIQRLLSAKIPDDDLAQKAVEVLRHWDLRTNPENRGAALAVLALQPFLAKEQYDVKSDKLIESLISEAKELQRVYGKIEVPWQQVNRLLRGDLNLGLGGGPDVLHAIYGEKYAEGKLKAVAGDSYILLVTWDKNGKVSSRSIHQFGSATKDKNSPHYADQAPLFATCQLKPVWMDEAEIQAHLEREYRPGEELLLP